MAVGEHACCSAGFGCSGAKHDMRRCSDSAKGSTFDAGGNVTTRTSTATTTAVASNLEGASVSISAGQDLTVKGSNVLADQSVNLNAGRNGKQQQSLDQGLQKTTAALSAVRSTSSSADCTLGAPPCKRG